MKGENFFFCDGLQIAHCSVCTHARFGYGSIARSSFGLLFSLVCVASFRHASMLQGLWHGTVPGEGNVAILMCSHHASPVRAFSLNENTFCLHHRATFFSFSLSQFSKLVASPLFAEFSMKNRIRNRSYTGLFCYADKPCLSVPFLSPQEK